MANKLKNMKFTSVDLVKRGANPDADIKLFKSADYVPDEQIIMKSDDEIEEMIQKSEDTMHTFADALNQSFYSILNDSSLTADEAREMMAKSLSEFQDAVTNDIIKSFDIYAESEVEDMIDIDKSALTAEEAETLDTLLAKACKGKMKKECGSKKKPPFAKEDMEDDDMEDDDLPPFAKKSPAFPPKKKTQLPDIEEEDDEKMKKSALNPTIQAALDRMENLAKGVEMQQFTQIAKKYAVLGEDESKLAETLYSMKKSNPENYDAYIAVLDKSLELVNNSGLFGEIGKSAAGSYGYTGSSRISKSETVSKIEAIAGEIMKSDPDMNRQAALAKAWEDHPELAIAYENE